MASFLNQHFISNACVILWEDFFGESYLRMTKPMHSILNINKLLLFLKKPCRIRQPCVQSTFCVRCSRAINTPHHSLLLTTTVKSAYLKHYSLPVSSDRSAHFFSNLSHRQGLSACKHCTQDVFVPQSCFHSVQTGHVKMPGDQAFMNYWIISPHFDVNINWCSWPVTAQVYKLCYHLIEWLHKWADVQVFLVHTHFFYSVRRVAKSCV